MKFTAVATVAAVSSLLVSASSTRNASSNPQPGALATPNAAKAFAAHREWQRMFNSKHQVRPYVPPAIKKDREWLYKAIIRGIPERLRLANPKMVASIEKASFIDLYTTYYGEQFPYRLLTFFLPDLFAGLNDPAYRENLTTYTSAQLEGSIRAALVNALKLLNPFAADKNHPFAVLINQFAAGQKLAGFVILWIEENNGNASLSNASNFDGLMNILFREYEDNRKKLISAMIDAYTLKPFKLDVSSLKVQLLKRASRCTATTVTRALNAELAKKIRARRAP